MLKLLLQIILGIFAILTSLMSLSGLATGIMNSYPPELLQSSLDNEIRYGSGVFLVLSLVIWRYIPNIENHIMPLRVICAALVMGGLGRLISFLHVGSDLPFQSAIMVMELLSPIMLFIQAHIPIKPAD